MADYRARNLKETNDALKAIRKKNTEMVAALQGSKLGRIAIQGGNIIEARAKEIITEKGHVVTGNLRRSINTQLSELEAFSATVEVGTFVSYGPYIENLPDGGYLYPASIQTNEQVTKFFNDNGVKVVLREWGR
jgi:hypothetical protein